MFRKIFTQTYQEIAADPVFSSVVPQIKKIMDLLHKNTGAIEEEQMLEILREQVAFFEKLSEVPDDPKLKIFQEKLLENLHKANCVDDKNAQDEKTNLTTLKRLKDKIEEEMIAEQDKRDNEDLVDKNHCNNDDGRESRIKLLTMILLAIYTITLSSVQYRAKLNTVIWGVWCGTIKIEELPRSSPMPINDKNSLDFFKPTGRTHWPTNLQSKNSFFSKYALVLNKDELTLPIKVTSPL